MLYQLSYTPSTADQPREWMEATPGKYQERREATARRRAASAGPPIYQGRPREATAFALDRKRV